MLTEKKCSQKEKNIEPLLIVKYVLKTSFCLLGEKESMLTIEIDFSVAGLKKDACM